MIELQSARLKLRVTSCQFLVSSWLPIPCLVTHISRSPCFAFGIRPHQLENHFCSVAHISVTLGVPPFDSKLGLRELFRCQAGAWQRGEHEENEYLFCICFYFEIRNSEFCGSIFNLVLTYVIS